MSYLFYRDILSEIAINLQYKSTVNLLARDYSDEEVFELVNNSNPLLVDLDNKNVKKPTEKITLSKLESMGFLK